MSESQNKTPEEKWIALLNVLELFRRYFSNEASARERNSIDTWEPIENEEELLSDKTLVKECDTALVWNAVSKDLKFNITPRRNRFHIHSIHPYAAAAVLFILLGGGILFFTQNNSFNRSEYGTIADANTFFQTTDAQTRQITLPDGSKIHLNRGTKVSYASSTFNRKQREVWLEGEAFFEVAKNPKKPFIVYHGLLQTVVKGTSFNIKAYKAIGEDVVSVRTGKVEIHGGKELFGTLIANQQMIYNNRNGKYQTEQLDWEDAAGWINGELILNYANVSELKLRMKQHFNIELEIQGNILDQMRIRSVFVKDTNLDNVMKSICGLYGLKYKVKDNRIIFYK